MALRWDKLSPTEFQQLQDLAAYSSRQLQQVLEEFCLSRGQSPDGDIDYDGFRRFLDTFLDVETPDELSRHLFLSFVRRPSGALTAETDPNHSHGPSSGSSGATSGGAGPSTLVGRLHGLTERLHLTSLHHHHHQKQADDSSRSRTGSVHPVMTLMQTSYSCQDGVDKKPTETSPNHSQMSRNSSRKSNNSLLVNNGKYQDIRNLVRKPSALDVHTVKVSLKDIVCYLSLLEAGRPEDKLEFMFRLYDTDDNGVLDTYEMDCIVNQMMTVAEYLGWDVSELRPILQEMMIEIDYDADGTVSLEEWKRGGLTTIPLLILLGLDTSLTGDGEHAWRLKHFNRPAYCNLCLTRLVGLGKKGLCCIFCKYTVHERCVQRAPSNCIQTHAGVSGRAAAADGSSCINRHHWVGGNCKGRCARCRAPLQGGVAGVRCRWCQILVHNRCCGGIKTECSLGPHAIHVLPPSMLFPRVLDRQRSLPPPTPSSDIVAPSIGMVTSQSMPITSGIVSAGGSTTTIGGGGGNVTLRPAAPTCFHAAPKPPGCPLLVFVNPKSGGRQGARIMRKFQYLLNPRQVHDLSKGGPSNGLAMFKDVQNFKVICCGGDGTVGWVLETMDKVPLEIQPAVGVIPLGTGNDLARCLRWGGGYEGESLHKVLDKIAKASTVMMDRWQFEVIPAEQTDLPLTPLETCTRRAPSVAPYNIINNYFSIGVDAAICVKFHVEREKNPEKFSSRMKNKLWYFEYATTEQFAASCKNLQEHIDIVCDGVPLELSKGSRLQGIALLNIPYAHGGSNLWGDPAPRRSRRNPHSPVTLAQAVQDIGDKLIEVIGLENCLHMGQVRTGLRASGQRLAQCKAVTIVTRKTLPMQIDGEPWMQSPCQINITHKNQVPMLMAPPPERSKGLLRFLPHC